MPGLGSKGAVLVGSDPARAFREGAPPERARESAPAEGMSGAAGGVLPRVRPAPAGARMVARSAIPLSADLESERVMEDEVLHFVTHETGYRAYTARGLRLDIIRSESIQPDIGDPGDYYTWLWTETFQGFYLMRQRVTASRAAGWEVVREFVPRDPYGFYFDFLDRIRPALRASGEVELPAAPKRRSRAPRRSTRSR